MTDNLVSSLMGTIFILALVSDLKGEFTTLIVMIAANGLSKTYLVGRAILSQQKDLLLKESGIAVHR